MSKIALYQKYRSSTFDEMVGQETTVRTIKNAVKENKVGHAYLFCGPRGTGKTSMARLLAKAVNCDNPEEAPCGHCENCIAANNGTHPDIIEINAANETHVDDIRDLIERAKLAPMVGRHKVYIIDEVHQLSSAASSALLKTLEEPPENVIFILATTDPQKLLPTIISRCQQYNFFRIKNEQISAHLLHIAEMEHIEMDEGAANKIAILANGGMRDALSIMDQCASFSNDHISEEDVDRIYGLTTIEEQVGILKDILNGDLASILHRVHAYDEQGIDINRMTDHLIDILKDASVYSYTKKADLLKNITVEQANALLDGHSVKVLMQLIDILMEGKNKYKVAQSAVSAFEVVCLQCIANANEPVVEQVVRQTAPIVVKKPEIVEEKKVEDPIAEELHIETPVLQEQSETTLDVTNIVQLLLLCNKEEKNDAMTKFGGLSNVTGLENAKYKSMLKDVSIAASGTEVVLLTTSMPFVAKRMNQEKENKELYFFLKDVLGMDKVPFTITQEDFANATKAFVEMRKANSLPEPYRVVKYVSEVTKEKTPEEMVMELFGKENVQVI